MKLVWGPPSKPNQPLVIFSGMGAVLLVVARFFPFDRYPLFTCPLRQLAHIPCMTCGMTRAFVRITHGQWSSAFTVSPLGAVLALSAAAFAIYTALRSSVLHRGIEVRVTPRESLVIRVGVVCVVCANWVYLLVSGAAS